MPYYHNISNIEGQLILLNLLTGHGKLAHTTRPLREKIHQSGAYLYNILDTQRHDLGTTFDSMNIKDVSYRKEDRCLDVCLVSPETEKVVAFQLPYAPDEFCYNSYMYEDMDKLKMATKRRFKMRTALSSLGKIKASHTIDFISRGVGKLGLGKIA